MTALYHGDRLVIARLEIARTFMERAIGLMGRRALPRECGLLITPCASIHTGFMRFPIDVLFLDRSLTVVKIVRELRPWRTAWGGSAARSTLEVAAGTPTGLCVGDPLRLADSPRC